MRSYAITALLLLTCATAHAQPAPQEGEPVPPQEGDPALDPEGAPPPAPTDPEAGSTTPDQEGGAAPDQAGGAEAPAPTGEQTPVAEGAEPTPAPTEQPAVEEAPAAITFAEPPAGPEEPAEQAGEPACDPAKEDCTCPKNWGCWELIYATKGTILGAKVTVTYSDANAPEKLDAGFVTFYSTEHFATRKSLSVHVLAFGGIGGGTASNEGSLGLGLDFGWRGEITETSGPFLRVGMTGMMMGHRSFYVSLFEPFQGRAGYQLLDGDTVLEAGLTHGIIPVGRFEPGKDAERDLSRTKELGGYVTVHRASYRADLGFQHVFDPEGGADRDDVEIGRAMYCDYRLGITLCADGLFTRGEARMGGRERMTNALYFGITVGLSP